MSTTNESPANAQLAVPRRLLDNYLREAAARLSKRREVLGERIREARETKGWLQKELAARVHVEPQTISNWERGATAPDLDKLEILSRELECPMAYFVADAPDLNGSSPPPDRLEEVLAEVSAARADLQRVLAVVEQLREDRAQAKPDTRPSR